MVVDAVDQTLLLLMELTGPEVILMNQTTASRTLSKEFEFVISQIHRKLSIDRRDRWNVLDRRLTFEHDPL